MGHRRHAKISKCDHVLTGAKSRRSGLDEEAVGDEKDDGVAVEPASAKSLSGLFATLKPVEDSFVPVEDIPPGPVDL
ncbi:MAG: AbrB/MazE/SpoVT family DNA-binding domain-containing protein [Sphingobium sp.]